MILRDEITCPVIRGADKRRKKIVADGQGDTMQILTQRVAAGGLYVNGGTL